jgi:hypothetical protein
MTKVYIYRPAKTAMQSGRRNTRQWILEFERSEAPQADPLMGWIGSGDTRRQVRLRFPDREAAIAYAERNGYTYEVEEPRQPAFRPKSYAENFLVGRS